MPPALGSLPTANPTSLEADARRLAARLEKGKYVFLLLFTILYAIGATLHARSKPLWFDEIITVIAASPADAATAWKAARDCDSSPPLPHMLTHFSMQWFGTGEIAIRLPAIAGFWVFCLCLFIFTRRLGIFYALVAMLLPIATEAYSYSYEARAYGMELAFSGLALVSWQAATQGRRRWLACAGISLSLICAIFCHYYALLLYIPLAGAEAFRSLRARRVDWPIWLAFALGGAPVVWRLASIRGVVQAFGHGTWSPAYPEQVVEFWETSLQHSLSFLVLGLAFMAIWMIRRHAMSDPAPAAPPALAPQELVAGILFLAIPIAAVGGGLVVTHMFVGRYALLAITGAVVLATAMAAHLSGGRSIPGFLLLCVAVLPLAFVTVEVPPRRDPFAEEHLLAEALQKGPVVIPDGQMFLQMWQYAPAALKPNIVFLADMAAASKYMGFDAIDGGLGVLRPWSSVQVQEYRDFATPGREFLVYQNSLKPGWVLARVLADGATADVQAYTNYRQLFRVRLK
jgi:hypothetical protein